MGADVEIEDFKLMVFACKKIVKNNALAKARIGSNWREYLGYAWEAYSKASKNFDSKRSTKFSHFTIRCIEKFVQEKVATASLVKVQRQAAQQGLRLQEGRGRGTAKKNPTDATLAAAMRLIRAKVLALHSNIQMKYEPYSEIEEIDRRNFVRKVIEDSLSCLDERDRRIMVLFYGLCGEQRQNSPQIARLGLPSLTGGTLDTHQAVRHVTIRSIKKMRDFIEKKFSDQLML